MGTIPSPTPASADVGVLGLGVMGSNIALNMADHGFAVAGFDINPQAIEQLVKEHPAGSFGPGYQGRGPGSLVPAPSLEDFVKSLKKPRIAVMLITAGKPTEGAINAVAEYLEEGDLIVDGGNAYWHDTERREAMLKDKGLLFVGSGVSGGEVGARFGPSLMPGCDPKAWQALKPIWEAIAAKVDPDTGKPYENAAPGKPVDVPGAATCTAYIGPGGSGHFVKMVHNGIEYADMQLIAESVSLMRGVLGMEPAQMAEIFAAWNETELDSYLIEITADILAQHDPLTGKPFVDVVLDVAGQKGTGRWTSEASLSLGVAAPTIAQAVFARAISADYDTRQAASKILEGPCCTSFAGDTKAFLESIRRSLYCAKLCAYAQGFALMAEGSRVWNWDLDFASIARIWRGGCIIRARFLDRIASAYESASGQLANLLLDGDFAKTINTWQTNWREVVATASAMGVAIPATGSALAYFDELRSNRVSANIIQAQRDYFGSHTYERVDQPRGTFFHLDWTDPNRPQEQA